MYFELTGVFNDGRTPGVDVQLNTRRQINFVRGSSLTVDVRMIYPDGSPVQLDGTTPSRLVVKKNSREWLKRLDIAGTILSPAVSGEPSPVGVMRFTANASAFTQILPGRYVYDVSLIIAGQRNMVVPLSHFFVQPSTIGPGSIPNS